jgi:hypothetical protein
MSNAPGTIPVQPQAGLLALARYYLGNIDVYFTLFNTCRKAADKKTPAPNEPFVEFHLEGMRQTINLLHDRVNLLISVLLYESRMRRFLDDKRINARQHSILSQLLDKGALPLDEIRRAPWYQSLYLKRLGRAVCVSYAKKPLLHLTANNQGA